MILRFTNLRQDTANTHTHISRVLHIFLYKDVRTFVIFWFTHIIKYQIESSQPGNIENMLRFTNLRQDDNLSGRTITSQAGPNLIYTLKINVPQPIIINQKLINKEIHWQHDDNLIICLLLVRALLLLLLLVAL